ncbi:serine/arginine-rich SC35-like splicing factor SCL30A [Tanacetum coccineum]
MKVTQQPFNQTRYIPASNMFTEQHFSRTSRVATWAPSLAYVPYRTTASTPLSINRDATWAPIEPRGFGFVQFVAEEAKYHMDIQILMGQQMTVLFAEENRKKPSDMRLRERRSGSRFSSDRRRSPPPRYSRSPCLPGPHLVAIPDHHLPAVITLLHPEEGTTQGAQVASLLMDKGVEAVVLDVACLIEWLLCYFHWFMLSSKSKEW